MVAPDFVSVLTCLTTFGLVTSIPFVVASLPSFDIFSALLAAFITMLSKLAEDCVRLFGCGVTSIFSIRLLSSSCDGLRHEEGLLAEPNFNH